jgi:hypothetical protein
MFTVVADCPVQVCFGFFDGMLAMRPVIGPCLRRR